MALKLYGSKISTCSQRVMLVMNELNIPYDLIDIDMMKGEHKAPEYVRDIHPFGKVPALEVDSLRIFESKAISRYLVAKYASPNSTLGLPKTLEDVALLEQAASVEYSYFEPSIFKLAYEKMFKKIMGHGEPDAATVKSLEASFTETLDYYERVLQKQDYLTGNVRISEELRQKRVLIKSRQRKCHW
ncbi:hypothetical protein KCU77_g4836, partial [Aureobasidium melanogenum]